MFSIKFGHQLEQHSKIAAIIASKQRPVIRHPEGNYYFSKNGPDRFQVLFTPLSKQRRHGPKENLATVQIIFEPSRIETLFVDQQPACRDNLEAASAWLDNIFRKRVRSKKSTN